MQLTPKNLRAVSCKLRRSLQSTLTLCSSNHCSSPLKKREPKKFKTLKFRPDSVIINNREQNKLFDNEKYKTIISKEKEYSFQKVKIRSRLKKLLDNLIVLDRNTKLLYNSENRRIPKSTKNKRPNSNIFTSKTSSLFSNEQDNIVFRYEDYSYTPEELLSNNFTKEELKIIANDPKYFMLNKPPFKGINLQSQYSLKAKLEEEDEEKKTIINTSDKKSQLLFKHLNTHSLSNDTNKYYSFTTLCSNQHKTKHMINVPSKEQKLSRNKKVNLKYNTTISHITNKETKESNGSDREHLFSSIYYNKVFETFDKRREYVKSENMYFIMKKKKKYEEMNIKHNKVIQQDRIDKYIIRGLVDTLKSNYLYNKKYK